jgi:tRNA(His) guanylyltransferase
MERPWESFGGPDNACSGYMDGSNYSSCLDFWNILFVGRGNMAKSRFEYVRLYEEADPLLQNTFIVVRIDGKGFHKSVLPWFG